MVAKTNTDTPNDPDFDARHAEDLGAKRFIQTKAAETFIPLGAAAAGGAVGYFTLGKPIEKMFPKFFSGIDHVSDIVGSLGDMTGKKLTDAYQVVVTEVGPEIIDKASKAHPGITFDSPNNIRKLLKHASDVEIAAVKDTLGIVSKGHGKTAAALFGAGALAMVGSIIGGVFVGYDKWRKEESTRLAANEIDKDISQLEIFSKRDPELIKENKRLRTMLDEQDTGKPISASSIKSSSARDEERDQPSLSVSGVEHDGKLESSLEKAR